MPADKARLRLSTESDDESPPGTTLQRMKGETLSPRHKNLIFILATLLFVSTLVTFHPKRAEYKEQCLSVLGGFTSLPIFKSFGIRHDDAMLKQGSRSWSDKEEKLREYRWGRQEVDKSLKLALAHLTDRETRMREWLLSSRIANGSGVGVGLGRDDPPENLRLWTPPAIVRGVPLEDEGPGKFEGGSLAKHIDLVKEWQTGLPVTTCETGRWQANYSRLHREMMNGVKPPLLLTYHCPANMTCGGLADRFLGIVSTLMYSVLTQRAFAIRWDVRPFDLLFDSAGYIDWSQPYMAADPLPHPIYDDPELVKDRLEIESHNLGGNEVDAFDRGFMARWKGVGPKWVRLDRPNRGQVIRAFELTDSVGPTLSELGFDMESSYGCLLDFLFRPKADSLRLISEYTSLLSLPSVFSVGIQIRAGDSVMRKAAKGHSIGSHRGFFNCADQLAKKYALPGQRIVYYLVSDSAYLKINAANAIPGKIIINAQKPQHTEIGGTTMKGNVENNVDGMMGAVTEMFTFRHTDYQVITENSGFGKFPVFARGRPRTTVVYPLKKKAPKNYCSRDSSLQSFENMGRYWSLG
ncbi:hypothetical protein T439DRAFT_63191 [Meredithblackwellia eburnea MCA 4105]